MTYKYQVNRLQIDIVHDFPRNFTNVDLLSEVNDMDNNHDEFLCGNFPDGRTLICEAIVNYDDAVNIMKKNAKAYAGVWTSFDKDCDCYVTEAIGYEVEKYAVEYDDYTEFFKEVETVCYTFGR